MKNVGSTDKIIRVVAALGFISLYFFTAAPVSYLSVVGLILLFTIVTGFCPLYKIVGLNTCPLKIQAKNK
jgi:hypothetical protein